MLLLDFAKLPIACTLSRSPGALAAAHGSLCGPRLRRDDRSTFSHARNCLVAGNQGDGNCPGGSVSAGRATAVLLFEVLLNVSSMFSHSNVKMPAWLDAILHLVVVTPDMHHVHHSVSRDKTNSNFGLNLPCWDYLRCLERIGHNPKPATSPCKSAYHRFSQDERFGCTGSSLYPSRGRKTVCLLTMPAAATIPMNDARVNLLFCDLSQRIGCRIL